MQNSLLRTSLCAVMVAASASCTPEQNVDPPIGDDYVPAWVGDAVFYQIFPERFRNGDPNNDPTYSSLDFPERVPATWQVSEWTADWYARADWERAAGRNFYSTVTARRYGGDLAGVMQKLDYLADLGVNAIYFNPLFYARSLHKYDGNSFHHIDPFFGPDPEGDLAMMAGETASPDTWTWTSADRLFLDLVSAAREKGIRIIMDGVWNHTGRDFFAFADIRRNGKDSPYADWYVIKSFDDPATPRNEFDWQGWWGHKPLPEFADTPDSTDLHPGPKLYVFDVTRRWMDPDGDGDPSDGIAGWRLDVVPDVPIAFWKDWNRHVRDINPDAYTVAEIWQDASGSLREGGFSGTMNYHAFAMPVKGFLVDDMMTGSAFVRMLRDRLDRYDPSNRFGLLNLVDSHDTPRIASMIVNRQSDYSDPDVFDYDRHSSPLNNRDYLIRRPNETERRIQRMLALLQATYVGAPMIYYGTEAGMWGADDPDDRMPMVWDDMTYAPQTHHPYGKPRQPDSVFFDRDLFDFYKRALEIRRETAALRFGEFDPAGSSDDVACAAFLRRFGDETVVVVMNRGDAPGTIDVPLPQGWTEVRVALSTGEPGDVRVMAGSGIFSVKVAPLTAALLDRSTLR